MPTPSFFARFWGRDSTNLTTIATALVDDTFTRFTPPPPGSNVPGSLLPFTVDIEIWNDMRVNGPDNLSFEDGAVQTVGDGRSEILLYPQTTNPGNFGTPSGLPCRRTFFSPRQARHVCKKKGRPEGLPFS